MIFSQLAIFALWMTALTIGGLVRRRGVRNAVDAAIASVGDPRRFFYIGLGAHVLTLAVGGLLRGTPQGRLIREVAYGAGPAVLAFAILFGAGYAIFRIGDEKVGLRLAGLLHPAADGLKTIFKEDFIPPNADRFLHSLAPIISFFPALVVIAVIPFGDTLCFGNDAKGQLDLTQLASFVPRDGVCSEAAVRLQALDLNVGVLYFFAMAGTGIVGAALAGWASDNKFSLLGGLRAASQMVSYEVTLGLTIVGAIMIYGTVRLDEMVRWQHTHAWGIFVQPVAFFLFFAAAVAESKRIPFDLPEGESEIVAGYYTEYSGMKFAMFFFAEYVAVVTSSALLVTLFLGGWSLPFVDRDGLRVVIGDSVLIEQRLAHAFVIVLGVLSFVLKTVALCFVQLTIRWTLPRFRYDQLMRLGWRKLLPASLVNILVTGLVVLLIQDASSTVQRGLGVLGDVTRALVAAVSIFGVVALVRFLLEPAEKRRSLASSAAQFAARQGGTREAPMQA
jgi:NADH-quinone oxidoreductase subunit H